VKKILLLILLVFVAGCVGSSSVDSIHEKDIDEDDIIETPPRPHTTPPLLLKTLTIYGSLLQPLQGEIHSFDIRPLEVDCTKNETALSIKASVTANIEEYTEIKTVGFDELIVGEKYTFYSKDLGPNRDTGQYDIGTFDDTFVDSTDGKTYILIGGGSSLPIENFDKAEYVIGTSLLDPSNLPVDENIIFYFREDLSNEIWILFKISKNVEEYENHCNLSYKN